MTIFEFLVLLALGAIVLSMMFGGYIMCKALDILIANQNEIRQDIKHIEVSTHHQSSVLQDHIAPDVKNIYNQLNELVDIEQKSDERNDNMFPWMQEVMRNYPPTYNPPCYAPDGICTNPQMDCINCPKRGTGGTWSTSINIDEEGGEQ